MFYMKRLREGAQGEFEVIKLDEDKYASVQQLLREVYEADGWADATEDEYSAQLAEAEQDGQETSEPEIASEASDSTDEVAE